MNRIFCELFQWKNVKKMSIASWKRCSFLMCIIKKYLVVVFVFAVINWLLFLQNSTSFLISEQLNKHIKRYEFLEPTIDLVQYHKEAKDIMPITIKEFGELIKPDLDKLEMIIDSLDEKNKKYKNDSLILDSLNNIAIDNRNEAIKAIKKDSLAKIQRSIDSLETYLAGKDSTEMIIQGKYVEMANLQYEYAKKNAQILSYIINHYGALIPDSLSLQISNLYHDNIFMAMDIYSLENERRAVSSKIRDSIISFHNNRVESVGFCDFIYYSICVSTTVSFGDIAPNDGKTRFFAIFELLICILLVANILDEIKKARSKNI